MTEKVDKIASEGAVSPTGSSRNASLYEDYDTPEDRRIMRKVDRHLLPILTLLYLLSFLDRTNIGNAKLLGLTTQLHVVGANYNLSLAIYFIAYVTFEVPSNVSERGHELTDMHSLKRFDPAKWLPSLTLVWGIVSVCQGVVKNQAGLFAVRFFLGMTEAGLFPGVIFLFSVYYRRRERHWRVAVFFGGAALAGAFGGILAFAIGKMDGIGGRQGWAWIFILEGILTIVVSLAAYWIVPTWAHKAKFLTEPERARLLARLAADSDAGSYETFEWRYVREAFGDHLVWAYAFLFHGFAFVLYSLSLFLPTIIANLGFVTWKAQLMTVPPNTVAALSIWAAAYAASRFKRRAVFIILAAAVAIIGYIILLAANHAGVRYFGVHLAAAGVYTGNALLLSWPGENVAGQTKRAVAVAMQITIGDIGAIAATGVLIYRPSFAVDNYRKPHIIAIGYVVFGALCASYLWFWMARENRRRDAIEAEVAGGEKGDARDRTESRENLVSSDRNLRYRYQI
ncbi:MFS general substrate transporter [Sistotremastrum suecicum HHB10207 ss-3]|uniref:MFS general substrate transporter n=1 Tax=Sistotremastrum suecicum HHB10207 ss-3 TaxID=1314776 RepID=A0A166FHX6_9AGAM|nr:MFS general substrate transporter [Sistotremastrum suecicum HHB10207 ss-3]